MAFYLSPLVAVNEYDATTTIPAVATSIACIVLRDTYKGPELTTQFISNINDLINVFGKPTQNWACYQDILAATGYLKYGNMLYCTRALGASAQYALAEIAYDPGDGEASQFASPSPSSYTLETLRSTLASAGGDINDFGDLEPNNFLTVIANSRGAWGNRIRVALAGRDAYKACAAATIDTTTTDTWSTTAAINRIDSPIDDDLTFIVLVQTVEQGLPTDIPASPALGTCHWVTQEVFNVSVNPEAFDDTGGKKFVETVINNTSQYIKVSIDSTYTGTASGCYVNNIFTPEWITLEGGLDDSVVDDPTTDDTEIMKALDLYKNPETLDVNIFIDSNKSMEIKQYINDICASRKDAMAILDCRNEDVLGQRGMETENLRTYVADELDINSSYSAIYGNWIEVYDKWNGKYRWIPASGHVAGLFANNDNVAEAWFAPAGPNRAIITGVRRLAWNPDLGSRNILYKNRINPIISMAGMGKLVYGQKTLLDKESAFNRINVRRLFMILEKAISTASRYFLFEPNDDVTRLILINMIDPFLRDVKARRGVYDYMLVCNETNNTPERIDRGELWCDIYIKPTRSAEFIILNFVATKTGASFSELSGLVGS